MKLLAAARGCLGAVLASELLRHAPSPLPNLYELGLRGCGLRAACVPPLCRAVAMLRTLQRLDLRDNPQLLGHDDADQAGTIATADGGTAAAVHLGTLCLHALASPACSTRRFKRRWHAQRRRSMAFITAHRAVAARVRMGVQQRHRPHLLRQRRPSGH